MFGLIGSLVLLYLLGVWVFTSHGIGTRPLLQLGILLEMLAVQLVGMGLLAELIIHRTDRNLDTSIPVKARTPVYGGSAPTGPTATSAGPTATSSPTLARTQAG